jgi:CTP:molybdopterin cytidylyltransferase MocA
MGHTARQRVSAVILAAGYSSRMGSFKPLLPLVEGNTVIATVINNLKAAGCDDVCVVTGHNSELLEAACHRFGARIAHNPDFDRGMYSSIVAGLSAQAPDTDACLLLPVDIPLVRPATLRQLLQYHSAADTRVVYPTFLGRRGHPPRIHRTLFNEIIDSEHHAGEDGLRGILVRHEDFADEIPVLDQHILLDMDTQEDYQRLRKLAEHLDIPSEDECEAILQDFNVADWIQRHSHKVAEVADCLAQALIRAGVRLNPERVLAAALLHDIMRGQPRHAVVGAAAVKAIGFADIAPMVACHMDMCFTGGTPDESAVVFLADKLVDEDKIVTLQARFQPAFGRFVGQPEALQGALRRYGTARTIAESVNRITGESVPDLLAPLIEQEAHQA